MATPHPDRRTRLVTALGILGVIVAGAFAVAANLGILSSSSKADVGVLAAAGDLVPSTSTAAVSPTAPPRSTSAVAAVRTYLVEHAGSVTLVDADPITINAVEAAPGWTWHAGPAGGNGIAVVLTDGTRALRFSAAPAVDGGIAAAVEDITASDTQTTSTTATPNSARDRDDDEHEHEVHEGRDDDD
jgi:hypothetical protein